VLFHDRISVSLAPSYILSLTLTAMPTRVHNSMQEALAKALAHATGASLLLLDDRALQEVKRAALSGTSSSSSSKSSSSSSAVTARGASGTDLTVPFHHRPLCSEQLWCILDSLTYSAHRMHRSRYACPSDVCCWHLLLRLPTQRALR
jgi:hypothetical protein